MNASFDGHERVVQLLLAAGANPDLQDKVRTAVYRVHYSPVYTGT